VTAVRPRPRTSLHLFEHVHGDSRDRGPAMIDLAQTYEKAGLYLAEGELPDYLPVVLEFASTQPPREARAFLGEMAHILNAIFSALQQRGSRTPASWARCSSWPAKRPGGAAAARPRSTSLGRPWPSTAAAPRARPGPGQPQPIQIVRASARLPPGAHQHEHPTGLHNFLFGVYPYICLAVF
jgi:nitrate reductase delta subunit